MSTTQPAPLADRGIVRGVFAGPIRALSSPRAPDVEATRWRSAILKSRQTAPVSIGTLGLAGDAQKEKKHHGGPTKAVLIYGAAHYAMWDAIMRPHADAHATALRAMSAAFDASHWAFGAFGENLCIDGLVERSVCLGDLWQIGTARLRITEPRGPCGTLTRRWMRPALLGDVKSTAAAGWYNAVERSGVVSAGDDVVLIERVQDQWTLAAVFDILESRAASQAAITQLRDAACTHAGLRERLDRRLSRA
jgi:MOSC domain-containing protein YiiM